MGGWKFEFRVKLAKSVVVIQSAAFFRQALHHWTCSAAWFTLRVSFQLPTGDSRASIASEKWHLTSARNSRIPQSALAAGNERNIGKNKYFWQLFSEIILNLLDICKFQPNKWRKKKQVQMLSGTEKYTYKYKHRNNLGSEISASNGGEVPVCCLEDWCRVAVHQCLGITWISSLKKGTLGLKIGCYITLHLRRQSSISILNKEAIGPSEMAVPIYKK